MGTYNKFVVSLVFAGLTAAQTVFSKAGPFTNQDWLIITDALLSAVAVWAVPNSTPAAHSKVVA